MRVCPKCHLCIAAATHSPCNEAAVEVQVEELGDELALKFSGATPLAQGSTGTLYLATHIASGQRGVLKLVPETSLGASTERVRAKRELRKQTTLPSLALVPVLEGGEAGTRLWLFREYVEGQSLAMRIAEHGPLSVQDAISVIAQVAIALDQLHRNGLLHRDLKPSHVLLAADESDGLQVKVIDAGLAGATPGDGVLNLTGTAEYLSPEQASGKPVSFRSDLYALGCIFYEALMGKPPFSGDAATVLAAHREALAPEVTAELPDAARDLLRSMLDKEPRRRPFSAQQVRRTLEPLLEQALPAALHSVPAAPNTSSLRPAVPAPHVSAERGPASYGNGRDTEALSTSEIEVLSVGAQAGRATELLDSQELDLLQVDDLNDAAHVASSPPPVKTSKVVSLPPPIPGAEPSAVVDQDAANEVAGVDESYAAQAASSAGLGRADSEAPTAAFGAGAVQAAAMAEEASKRRAVNFDVESLFAGESSPPDSEAGRGALDEDAAPTHVMERLQPEFGGKSTSSTGIPGKSKVPAWAYLAAPIAIALLWLAFSGDDEPQDSSTVGAEAAQEEAAPATAANAAPDNAPSKPEEGVAKAAAEEEAKPVSDEAVPAATDQAAVDDTAQATADQAADTADQDDEAANSEDKAVADNAENPSDKDSSSANPRRSGPVKAKLRAAGPSAAELKTQARQAYAAKQYADAAKLYQQVTKLSPRDAGAYAGLGASQLAAGNKKAAVASYQRAVQLQPKTSGFHAALGRAYFENGDKKRAIASYEKALDLNPKNGAAQAALAQLK